MSVAAIKTETPWLTCREAAGYLKKSPSFVMREVNAGRLKAARIGSKRQVLTSKDWLDAWVHAAAEIHPLRPRRV